MNSVLRQLALAVGGILFCVSLVLSLTGGIPLFTALFRGGIVMLLGTMAAALFFRFFMGVLYTSILQQMEQQRKAQEQARKQKREG